MYICECDLTDDNNELKIGWSPNKYMIIEVRGEHFELSPVGGYRMADLAVGWHKNCFTFKSGNETKVGKFMFSQSFNIS